MTKSPIIADAATSVRDPTKRYMWSCRRDDGAGVDANEDGGDGFDVAADAAFRLCLASGVEGRHLHDAASERGSSLETSNPASFDEYPASYSDA